MRSTRKQCFCWQEKKVLRLLRDNFEGTELVKLRNLYLTITEIDSDFNNQDIKYFTKTIATYSGLSAKWIPSGLKIFEKLKMIEIVEEREKGQFKGKKIVFTPDNIDELGIFTVMPKTANGKTANGKTANGFCLTSEDILYQEDILYKKNHDNHDKELDVFENLFKEFGINYTTTNQASVKKLLKTMSEKEVIKYLTDTYNALKENKNIKSIARVFSAKIQKGERQVNSKPKVEKTNDPIISIKEKETKVTEVQEIKPIVTSKKTLGEKDLPQKDELTIIKEAVSKQLRGKIKTIAEYIQLNGIIDTKKTIEEVIEFAKKYNIKI